ncbi:MAG: asparagine synthase-related protein, partial [Trueperaceae bacterium]
PHGLLLSGGVDSGSIAAAAGWAWQRGDVDAPLRAYSWAFEELVEHDERGVSSLITGAYGLPAIAIPADDAWSLAGFPAHGPARDDPYLNPIQPLIDRSLQTAATDGVRTLLSGDRGDPVAGDIGFDYPGALHARRWGRISSELRSEARSSRTSLARTAARRLIGPALQRAGLRPPMRRDPIRLVPDFLSADLVRRTSVREVIAADLARWNGSGSARDVRAGWITRFKGRLDPVPQERRRAMHGLAFADPWADLRVIEFVLAIPPWRLQRAGASKHLVREAMRPLAPAAVDQWRHGDQQGLIRRGVHERARATVLELVERPQLVALGLVDEEALRVAAHAFVDGSQQHFTFWLALSLEIWLRAYAA